MLGFRKKKNYEERFRFEIKKNNLKKAEIVAREAFSDTKADEGILAWIAGSIFEHNIPQAFDLLQKFLERYPNSLQAIRVYFADILARMGNFDSFQYSMSYA